ncbi:WD40/YVTN/BNR-like repeat-containing protein [Candidatus Viridilinea mediisalina]|uniref:Uncharacterized protein n=1 Tax=Candidatus Viridilinea mediisalina TaxID=2024553 RepID=A0A2A6RD11_9CHLR|nr:hypothetical protein [Candidatus Viridilinea mediisalina]PDV99540.1 hypothetical protein CJ255_21470 [Candidatus Viridilinea mediisalina]
MKHFPFLLLLIALLLLPTSVAQAQTQGWEVVPGVPADIQLEALFVPAEDHAWAVGQHSDGNRGFVYRLQLQDGRWHVEEAASFEQPLFALVALDRERVVVAGGAGLIARRDAAGHWRQEGPGDAAMQVRSLALFADGQAGWALGTHGERALALRYADGRWFEAELELPNRRSWINAAHFAPNAGWAVGSHLWRLDGNGWRLEPSPALCGDGGNTCELNLTGVRVLDHQHAWLVGSQPSMCMFCQAKGRIAFRDASGWQNAFPQRAPIDSLAPPVGAFDSNMLTALYMFNANTGLALGQRRYQTPDNDFSADVVALRYRDGTWHYERPLARSNAIPKSVVMPSANHALVVGTQGLILSFGYGPQTPAAGNPAQPVPDPGLVGVRYFPETGHTLRGTFRTYWERNGGLMRFGYPLTEEFPEVNSEDGRTYTVQYFERARFEYHPEHAGTPYEVLLGLLGHWVTAERKAEAPFQPTGPSGIPGDVYFPETGFSMAAEFVNFWRSNGGLPIYGYPISAPFYEVNQADGNSYLVQYFERNRFEYHPRHAGTPYEVLLGLLGSEYLRAQGWR